MAQVQRKLNLSSFDVSQLVKEFQSHLVTTRVNSFGNSTGTTYVMRTATSARAMEQLGATGLSGHDIEQYQKFKLLIQPGVRAHLTQFDQKVAPPNEVSKYIRSKIVNRLIFSVNQLNFDRVIIFGIGLEEIDYYLIIELYGKGNLILTDQNLVVLTAQNYYKNCQINTQYQVSTTSSKSYREIVALSAQTFEQFDEYLRGQAKIISGMKNQKNAKQMMQLRYQLASNYFIGGAAASIIIRRAGLSSGVKVDAMAEEQKRTVYDLTLKLLGSFIRNSELAERQEVDCYIYFYTKEQISVAGLDAQPGLDQQVVRSLYLAEFYPIDIRAVFPDLYAAEEAQACRGFNRTLDTYFSMLETCQQYQSQFVVHARQHTRQASVLDDNRQRVSGLVAESQLCTLKARLVQLNALFVDRYLELLAGRLAGVGFGAVGRLMQAEADGVFRYVDSVDLVTRVFQLRLPLTRDMAQDLGYDGFDEVARIAGGQDAGEAAAEPPQSFVLTVPFRLSDTAGKIAGGLYERAQQLAQKAGKTEQQQGTALRNVAGRGAAQQLQLDELKILQRQASLLWFERFHWFVSSDGYLVVGGRDAQQNEILVKRFMAPTDLFVHADVQGASCVVVKQDLLGTRVPPEATLRQAACLSVAHSRAWEARLVPQSYYVFPHQVSKTAPTGQYIAAGSFVIRGRRNYIQAATGLAAGLLFRYEAPQPLFGRRLESEATQRHVREQAAAPRPEEAEAEAAGPDQYICTKKQRPQRATAEDAVKRQNRERQRAEKKARQEIVKQQRHRAKLRRLEREGRTDVLERIARREQETGLRAERFCILCQSQQHFYHECAALPDMRRAMAIRLPPIVAQFADKPAPADVEALEEHEEVDELDAVAPTPGQTARLSQAMLFFDAEYRDGCTGCAFMVGPVEAFGGFPGWVDLAPGTQTQRGQAYKALQQIYQRHYQGNAQVITLLKGVPDHTVLMAVPGGCVLQPHGLTQ